MNCAMGLLDILKRFKNASRRLKAAQIHPVAVKSRFFAQCLPFCRVFCVEPCPANLLYNLRAHHWAIASCCPAACLLLSRRWGCVWRCSRCLRCCMLPEISISNLRLKSKRGCGARCDRALKAVDQKRCGVSRDFYSLTNSQRDT